MITSTGWFVKHNKLKPKTNVVTATELMITQNSICAMILCHKTVEGAYNGKGFCKDHLELVKKHKGGKNGSSRNK